MLDSSSFTGFIYSKLQFSSRNKRWEIVRITDENQVLAYMDKSDEHFPTGTHHWYFEDVDCTDPGEKWRSLNLHMDVKKPENFCCHDGTCISSELVCNNFADCEDKSDEGPGCKSTNGDGGIPVNSCPNGHFECDHGICYPISFWCNRIKECSDGKD